MEAITLLGVIVTFLTTVVGWIFTYRTQLAILKKQSDYQFNKEQQKALIDDNLAFVGDLQTWFEKGRKIYLESASIAPLEIQKIKMSDIDKNERIKIIDSLASRSEDIDHIIAELQEVRAVGPRLYYLSKIYDPNARESPHWVWGSQNMPDDLPQIIDNFENEVMDQVNEMLYGDVGRAFPKIEDQFHSLHEAGILAIEKIKSYLVFQNRTEVGKTLKTG